jgi:hypothetical protein
MMRAFTAMTTLSTIAGRVKTSVGGLLLTAFSLVFVVAGISMVVKSARQAATYLPATATVDEVTGTGEESDKASVAYSFSVDGKRYTGKESADDEHKARFNELRQCKVGQELTVYYDPQDPAQSQLAVKAEASGLAFTIFALPFLALALNQLWLGLTGKELVRSRQVNAQSDAVPGGGLFLVFVGTCVAGTVGQLVLCSLLRWPWSLAGGLTILFVAIPAVNLWANRLIKRRRLAKAVKQREIEVAHQAALATAARDDSDPDADAEEDLDAEDYLTTLGSLRSKLAIALGVTIFWCGITGAFAYFAIGSLVRHHYAALRFASAEGVVLSSKVKASSGSKGSNYAPKIKYRYTVAGQEYVAERYDFASMSASDSSYAQRAVSDNPPGKAVTVYYDPDKPSEAVLHLEAPGSNYFMLLFLQPFLLVGLAMIGWCATLPVTHTRLRQFFMSDTSPPWAIPGWGVMDQEFEGLVIRGRRSVLAPLGHFLVGYGLTCFFSIFVVGFLFHGFGDANVDAIRWAFLVAGCVGAAALLRKLFSASGTSRVLIDPIKKRLAVHSRRRDLDASFGEIEGLRLREIPYPGGVAVNGQTMRYLLLEAAIEAGQPLPLHAFRLQPTKQGEVFAVAHRAGFHLAELIGCPGVEIEDADDEPEQPAPSSGPAQAFAQLAGLLGVLRGDSYSDLT